MYSGKKTKQKDIIYEELKVLPHPSATMVYEGVHHIEPNISRATVFRVLSQFAEEGFIKKLEFSATDVRYDWQTFDHYHFRCKNCGCVCDVEVPFMQDLNERAKLPEGFTVEYHDVQFVGICKECQKNKCN